MTWHESRCTSKAIISCMTKILPKPYLALTMPEVQLPAMQQFYPKSCTNSRERTCNKANMSSYKAMKGKCACHGVYM